MKFSETAIVGSYLINLDLRGDRRGFFARTFCENEFQEMGLESRFVQANISYSATEGTLRGLHYQRFPHEEAKLVRCLRGALFDVVLDLRTDSASFGKYHAVELTAKNRLMIYVPQGCAHGFMTLKPSTEIMYLVTSSYSPEAERGVRFDDPTFCIDWPMLPLEISEKDANYPDYTFNK